MQIIKRLRLCAKIFQVAYDGLPELDEFLDDVIEFYRVRASYEPESLPEPGVFRIRFDKPVVRPEFPLIEDEE